MSRHSQLILSASKKLSYSGKLLHFRMDFLWNRPQSRADLPNLIVIYNCDKFLHFVCGFLWLIFAGWRARQYIVALKLRAAEKYLVRHHNHCPSEIRGNRFNTAGLRTHCNIVWVGAELRTCRDSYKFCNCCVHWNQLLIYAIGEVSMLWRLFYILYFT